MNETITPPKSVDLNTPSFQGKSYNLANPAEFTAYQNAVNQPKPTPTSSSESTSGTTIPKRIDAQGNVVDKNTGEILQTKDEKAYADKKVEIQQHADAFQQTTQDFLHGAIPISNSQESQLQGLSQQFQQLIENEKLQDTAAVNQATLRGIQGGAQEHMVGFAPNIISSVYSAGQQRVAKLSIAMASALAQLTSGFETDNFNIIKSAYDQYQEVADKQKEELEKTITNTQDAIAKAQEQQRAAQRDNNISKVFDQGITNPSQILQQLNDAGADYTLSEVNDALKIINPPADLAGLSPDYRTYLALKNVDDPSVKNMDWIQYQRAVTNATTKASSNLGSGGNSISPTTKAVIDNPSLFDDLTPTLRGQVVAELQANGFNTTNLGTKTLSDTAIGQIAQTQSAISNLNDLKSEINSNIEYVGPISGLAALNPYSKAKQIQAEINRVKQVVGKALEGGVLRKEDEDKYKQILATITDTPETAIFKIDALISSIQRDIETYKSLQQSGGRSLDVTAPLILKGQEVPVEDLRTKYGY